MSVSPPSPSEAIRPAPAEAERLASPTVFLWAMLVFLALAAFVALILGRQVLQAFATNPGLNGLIVGVLAVGILMALNQVLRLRREVRWVNALRDGEPDRVALPVLLLPMRALLGRGGGTRRPVPPAAARTILDSVGTRLDEGRDTARYLIGLLVFLGLLGTFWGLLTTIGSISSTIQSLDPSAGDANTVLNSVRSGLSAPLSGMGTAFSSSLFGLTGSMVLGFLDLQNGRAQNRFYTELEDWLATVTDTGADTVLPPAGTALATAAAVPNGAEEFRVLSDRINRLVLEHSTSPRTSAAMASLAESIQGLVQHMRGEQQMLRDFVDQQAGEQREMRQVMERLQRTLDTADAERR